MSEQDQRSVTAHDIFMGCGFEAVAGFPLRNGFLAVALPPVGVVQTTPAEWERYMALCEDEARGPR